jgi:hypothetical protein
MIRLHAGGPNRYYLCLECGEVKKDVYRSGAIVEHRWHTAPDSVPSGAVRKEALKVLEMPKGEQLELRKK